MKIAIAQTEIIFEDKSQNINKAIEFIKEASTNAASLILFPEMSFTGFSMNVDKIADSLDETLSFLKEISAKYSISIGAGFVKKNQNGLGENHYALVSSNGDILFDYIKRHPFTYGGETKYFTSGNDLVTASICDVPISVQICFDLRFPTGFFKLANDTHLMLVPANWPEKRICQYRALLTARAIENQYYVLGINCTGEQGKITYNGQSVLISPKGDILLDAGNLEGLYYYDFQDDVLLRREKFPVLDDRRFDD